MMAFFFYAHGTITHMEGINNIVPVDFRSEGDKEKTISTERRQELFMLAETMHQLEQFLETATFDETVVAKVQQAMLTFTGSMYSDLVASTPEQWVERPEYFRVIADTFMLPSFPEMQLYTLFRDNIAASEASHIADAE